MSKSDDDKWVDHLARAFLKFRHQVTDGAAEVSDEQVEELKRKLAADGRLTRYHGDMEAALRFIAYLFPETVDLSPVSLGLVRPELSGEKWRRRMRRLLLGALPRDEGARRHRELKALLAPMLPGEPPGVFPGGLVLPVVPAPPDGTELPADLTASCTNPLGSLSGAWPGAPGSDEELESILDPQLRKAVRPAAEMIDRLTERVPVDLRPILRELRCRFFQSGNVVSVVKEVTGAGTWLMRQFTKEVGLTAKKLILECRMLALLGLARDTPRSVEDNARSVGYSGDRALYPLSREWCGMPPGELSELSDPGFRHVSLVIFSWLYLERLRRGELTREEAAPFFSRLESLYGKIF